MNLLGSENSHYNNFNLLRLFAAFQVVYIHGLHHLKIENVVLLNIGSYLTYFPGVPIFFFISGYLITMSYEKNNDLRIYYKNRILRIYPALYVNFFIGILILYYFNQFENVNILSIVLWVSAQITLFQFYNPEFIRDFGVGVINGSLWTISVELVFYISLPMMYKYLKKDFYKRFLWLMSISLAFYFYITNISTKTMIYEKLIHVSIFPYLFYFLIGFYFYQYNKYIMKYIENKVYIYLLLYLSVCYFNIDNFIYLVFKQAVFSLFVFSAIYSCKSLSYKLMKYNDFTYGIYIYHMLIINVMVQTGYIGGGMNLIVLIALSTLSGIISYLFVEKPFLKLKKKSLFNEINK